MTWRFLIGLRIKDAMNRRDFIFRAAGALCISALPAIVLAKDKDKDRDRDKGKKKKRDKSGKTKTSSEVRRALEKNRRYKNAKVVKIFARRPANTESGFMYEAVMRNRSGREFLVYVDPASGRVLYDTAPR